jgi:hypothetical protein
VAGAGLEAVEVVEGAGLAVEGLEAEASAAVWGPDSLGADRASVPEAFGTSVGVAGSVIVIGSSSSAISAFTIRSSTDTILTATDTILTVTDIILTATDTGTATMDTGTDTVLTISPVMEVIPPGEVPRFAKSRCV